MTWINFLTYIGMGYVAYYLFMFLLDSKASPGKSAEPAPVLTFSETVEPEKISLEDIGKSMLPIANTSGPASLGLGGVSIKDLFALARKDAIEFTKSVSF